jgi:hypothetical protein
MRLLTEVTPVHCVGMSCHTIISHCQIVTELGKALATDARGMVAGGRRPGADTSVAGMKEAGAGNAATASLLSHYLSSKL